MTGLDNKSGGKKKKPKKQIKKKKNSQPISFTQKKNFEIEPERIALLEKTTVMI